MRALLLRRVRDPVTERPWSPNMGTALPAPQAVLSSQAERLLWVRNIRQGRHRALGRLVEDAGGRGGVLLAAEVQTDYVRGRRPRAASA